MRIRQFLRFRKFRFGYSLKDPKFTSGDPTIAAVEAGPAKPYAPAIISTLLQDLLRGNPAAEAELRKVLEGAGGLTAITQTANVTHDNNKTAQVAGPGNTAQIS